MADRIKVLLSAYACEPGKGSEPYVGWSWAKALSQHCDVTVMTRANNRGPIEKALANISGPRPSFIYYDPSVIWLKLKKAGLPVSIFYVLWQIGARKFMAHQLNRFDIVHHLTFNSFTVPGFWWKTEPVVILGPLGGGMTAPWKMLGLFGLSMPLEVARYLYVGASRWNILLRKSLKHSRAIIVANKDTARRIPSLFRTKLHRLLETGITESIDFSKGRNVQTANLRLVWIGTLTKRKCPLLALLALAKCVSELPHLQLEFVGDGTERERLVQLSRRLGLSGHIKFTGWLPHEEAQKRTQDADIFLFTSLRDTSGNVVLEAMAAGLPSVVLCHHGVAEMTTPDTAIRVAPGYPEKVAQKLAGGILTLARDPDLRAKMGEAARQRVLELFTWEKKSAAMLAIYRQALAQKTA